MVGRVDIDRTSGYRRKERMLSKAPIQLATREKEKVEWRVHDI